MSIRNLFNDPRVGRVFGVMYVAMGIVLLQNVVSKLEETADELQRLIDERTKRLQFIDRALDDVLAECVEAPNPWTDPDCAAPLLEADEPARQ